MRKYDIVFIHGDGIAQDIEPQLLLVIEALEKKFNFKINFIHGEAGDSAVEKYGKRLPEHTLDLVRKYKVAIKGPLTTAKGEKSSNVYLRTELELFSCVRPCKYFPGMDSPLKNPNDIDIVIFRENLEDLYVGIEFARFLPDTNRFIDYTNNLMKEVGIKSRQIPKGAGIALKYTSEERSRDIMNAGIEYALSHGYKSVTVVAKYNVMQATELLFEESCRAAFDQHETARERLEYKKLITDNSFQQVVSDPQSFGVIVTPNVSGDYLSDAVGAVVGGKYGIGFLPGANIGKECAVFEAVHGSWPDAAGKDIASPIAITLSAKMMLDHIGETMAAAALEHAVKRTILFMHEQKIAGIPLGTKAIGRNIVEQIKNI